MTDPFLGVAIYIILWWLAFFCMLPIGVKNLDEAGDAGGIGQERAAPVRPNLGQKAIWAAILAAVVWGVVQAGVAFDVFSIRS